MTATGALGKEFSWKGRTFPCAGEDAPKRNLDDTITTREANGNSTTRLLYTPKVMSINGIVVEIDNSREDYKFLLDEKKKGDGEFVLEFMDNVIVNGVGCIDGEIDENRAKGTASFNFSCSSARMS